MSGIQQDFKGAIFKTQTLKTIPKATKYLITKWAADTLKTLKRSAAGMKKSGRGRKTGQLARNVGMLVSAGEDTYSVTLGTGLEAGKDVVYARIQDQGGEIRPRRAKALAIPLAGVKGVPRNFPDLFFIKTKRGTMLLCRRDGKGRLKPMFLLKDKVQIPPSGWFSVPLANMVPVLKDLLSGPSIYNQAAKMAAEKIGPGASGGM